MSAVGISPSVLTLRIGSFTASAIHISQPDLSDASPIHVADVITYVSNNAHTFIQVFFVFFFSVQECLRSICPIAAQAVWLHLLAASDSSVSSVGYLGW